MPYVLDLFNACACAFPCLVESLQLNMERWMRQGKQVLCSH